MLINIIMILAITLLAGSVIWLVLHTRNTTKKALPTRHSELKAHIRSEIELASTMTVTNIGLSLENKEKQLRQREDLRNYIRNACSGDRGARKATYQLVRDKLMEIVNEENISDFCIFAPGEADAFTMFESLLYINDSSTQDKLKGITTTLGLSDDGFYNIAMRLELCDTFTLGQLSELYAEQYPMLDYEDKVEIYSQKMFAELYGLGVIDSLNYQKKGIEEIQIGLRGPQTRAYDYRVALTDGKTETDCAKDAVDVIFHGIRMHLEYLSFKTDAEMQRVINNLIINCNAGELTEKNPKIVTDTIDGRRIAIARPPQADAWIALIRKFNMLDIKLENLYKEHILVDTLNWITRSGSHIAVTGEMETGKTTLLRALLALTDPKYSIRIIENDSFELNGRLYFPTRNVTSFRVTEDLDEEEVLAFVRKTSGQIFSIGEVNQLSMANLASKLTKIATQMFFSAHYVSTENMVADFKDAKIASGFTSDLLAQRAAVDTLDFDVHIVSKDGKRYIEYINEVVADDGPDGWHKVQILKGSIDGNYQILNAPSEDADKKAKRVLSAAEYEAYKNFWNAHTNNEKPAWLN